jgi:hypothetical protein
MVLVLLFPMNVLHKKIQPFEGTVKYQPLWPQIHLSVFCFRNRLRRQWTQVFGEVGLQPQCSFALVASRLKHVGKVCSSLLLGAILYILLASALIC